MNYPKITIITPSLNQGPFLEATLRSVLDQDYPDLEYYVFDGGSTDSSVQILEKYSDRLTHWESNPDGGQSEAINKGLAMATGEIVNWLNSDDQLTEGSLLKVGKAYNGSPKDVGLVYGTALQFDETGPRRIAREFDQADINRYLAGVSFPQSAAFIRKSILDKVGYLNPDYHYGMDYDLYSRMALVCEFKRLPDQFAKNRLHKESKESSQATAFTEDWILIFNGLADKLGWHTNILEPLGLKRIVDVKLPVDRAPANCDPQKVMFYFLTEILRADYRNSNFERARLLKEHLQQNYLKAELNAEQEIEMILSRLRFPDLMIKSLRKVPLHRMFTKSQGNY